MLLYAARTDSVALVPRPAPTEAGLAVADDSLREQFYRLFQSHYAELVRVARLLGGGADAEDLVQSAFVNCYRRGALRDPARAVAYLHRSVINLTRSRWRRESTVAKYSWLHRRDLEPETDIAAEVTVRRALAQLPRRQREAVVLRYFLDLSEAQTAELMGVSLGSVKAYTSRALDQLTTLLTEDPR